MGSVLQGIATTRSTGKQNSCNSAVEVTIPRRNRNSINPNANISDEWSKYTIKEKYKPILVDENPFRFPQYVEKSDTTEQNNRAVQETLLLLDDIIIETNDNQRDNSNYD
jgi:hypothetical protein